MNVNEQRFSAFLQHASAGVCQTDTSGRYLWANPAYCRITGYTEAELLQRRMQDLTHPEDLPANLAQFQRLVDDAIPFEIQKRYIRKDGQPVWVHLNVTLIGATLHFPRSVVTVALDITERKLAEEAQREAQENYRTLFNSIDEGFCVIEMVFAPDGTPVDYLFLEINPVFEKETGLPNAQGRSMKEMIPEHEQSWFDIYGRVAMTGEPIRFENFSRPLNRWFSLYAFRVGPAEKRRVAVIFNNITEKKRAQQRNEFLSDLAGKLSAATDESEIIRTAVTSTGRFLQCHRCYFIECLESANLIVISENWQREGTPSLEGTLNLFDFGGVEWWHQFSGGNFSVEDVQRHPLTAQRTESYLQLGVRSYIVQPYRREGKWTVVLAATEEAPRAWTEHELKVVDDVVARVWPMVERARADRALRQSQEELQLHAQNLEQHVAERTAKLQETVSELESFSYSISHDLRAPLRAMQTYAAILASDCGAELSQEAREYIRRIVTASERMDRLIQDVLVYSRIARTDTPLERIDLNTFVHDVLASYPNFSASHAQIEVVSPLAPVQANAAALTQCVSNLLSNAVKFVAPGVTPRIRLWTTLHVDRVHLYVQDNGIGIPLGAREKIFGIFYQLNPKSGGTGIGLAVARKAAERMGAFLNVVSAPGEGTTFCIDLVAAPPVSP